MTRYALKRIIDIFGAGLGLVFFSPLMLLIAFLIYVIDGPPVFFLQRRAGVNGEPFVLFKYRTMRPLDNGAIRDDAARRITRLGRILRGTSLDELPQLLNVLKGDMSLVGPRPLHVDYVPLYNSRQRLRLNMKPGITGWAQVNGRNALTWEERFELDVWYVENWSLCLDFAIIVKTLLKVVKADGVGGRDGEIPARFRGTIEEHMTEGRVGVNEDAAR